MDLEELIHEALAVKEKHGNIKVRVGGQSHHGGLPTGESALDTSIWICEGENEFEDCENVVGEKVFMIWKE
jgi:hypothetical protein